MEVDCCYRLHPFGEIIWGTYHTLTGTFDNIPSDVFSVDIDPSKWTQYNYSYVDGRFNKVAAEWSMFCDFELCACIEYNHVGFLMVTWDGVVYFTDKLYKNKSVECVLENTVTGRIFKIIGVRPTKVVQYYYKPYIYGLQYDVESKSIYTQDGVLSLEETLYNQIDFNPNKRYNGYKDMLALEAFASLSTNGGPLPLYKNEGILIGRRVDLC